MSPVRGGGFNVYLNRLEKWLSGRAGDVWELVVKNLK